MSCQISLALPPSEEQYPGPRSRQQRYCPAWRVPHRPPGHAHRGEPGLVDHDLAPADAGMREVRGPTALSAGAGQNRRFRRSSDHHHPQSPPHRRGEGSEPPTQPRTRRRRARLREPEVLALPGQDPHELPARHHPPAGPARPREHRNLLVTDDPPKKITSLTGTSTSPQAHTSPLACEVRTKTSQCVFEARHESFSASRCRRRDIRWGMTSVVAIEVLLRCTPGAI